MLTQGVLPSTCPCSTHAGHRGVARAYQNPRRPSTHLSAQGTRAGGSDSGRPSAWGPPSDRNVSAWRGGRSGGADSTEGGDGRRFSSGGRYGGGGRTGGRAGTRRPPTDKEGDQEENVQDLIAETLDLRSLSHLINLHGSSFKSINYGSAAVRAYNLRQAGGPKLAAVLVQSIAALTAAQKPARMQPMHVANVLWALAKLGAQPPEGTLPALTHLISTKLRVSNAKDLASVVYAMGKLGVRDEELVSELVATAAPQLQSFTPSEVASTLHALVKLDAKVEGYADFIAKGAKSKLPGFTTAELSNTLLAIAELEVHDRAFMKAFVNRAKPQLAKFTTQNLSTALLAMAQLQAGMGWKDEDGMLQEIVKQLRWSSDMKASHISSTLLALAMLQAAGSFVAEGPFVARLVAKAQLKLGEFSPRELCNCCRAMAVLEVDSSAFSDALVKAMVPKLRNLDSRNLSLLLGLTQGVATLSAFSVSPSYMEVLLPGVVKEAEFKLRTFTPRCIATSLLGLAGLGQSNEALVVGLLGEAKSRLAQFTAAQLASLLAALPDMQGDNAELAEDAAARLVELNAALNSGLHFGPGLDQELGMVVDLDLDLDLNLNGEAAV